MAHGEPVLAWHQGLVLGGHFRESWRDLARGEPVLAWHQGLLGGHLV